MSEHHWPELPVAPAYEPGLRQLMRLHRHADAYREYVFELAGKIVQTAEDLTIAESRPVDFGSVRSAFHAPPSASLAATHLAPTLVVMRAFAEAGKSLRPAGEPGVFPPGPVWISQGRRRIGDELRRFANHTIHGRLAYLVHSEDLDPGANAFLETRSPTRGFCSVAASCSTPSAVWSPATSRC